jgi:hypothetical protein
MSTQHKPAAPTPAAAQKTELPEISDTEKFLFQYLGHRSPVVPLGWFLPHLPWLRARSHAAARFRVRLVPVTPQIVPGGGSVLRLTVECAGCVITAGILGSGFSQFRWIPPSTFLCPSLLGSLSKRLSKRAAGRSAGLRAFPIRICCRYLCARRKP